jgi:hypothetical protein
MGLILLVMVVVAMLTMIRFGTLRFRNDRSVLDGVNMVERARPKWLLSFW